MLISHNCKLEFTFASILGFVAASCVSSSTGSPAKCDCTKAPIISRKAVAGPLPKTQHEIEGSGVIREWTILGPFPNPERDGQRSGLDTDYLVPIGGESKASIVPGLRLDKFEDAPSPQAALLVHSEDGRVDFEKILGRRDRSTAYAMARLDSNAEKVVRFYLGSDDGARVWVNGEPAFRVVTAGRPLIPGQDRFIAKLHRGPNAILVKVEDATGDWGFQLQAFDEQGYHALQQKIDISKALVSVSVRPKQKGEFMFSREFPTLIWKQAEATPEDRSAIGEMRARWFNPQFVEETRPSQPGRYLAYAEARTQDGKLIRRSQTFFCRPPNWKPSEDKTQAFIHFGENAPFNPRAIEEHRAIIADSFGHAVDELLETSEDGVALAAYLHELKATRKGPRALDEPSIASAEAHLELRRKVLGLPAPIALRPPELIPEAAPVVQTASPTLSGIKPAAIKRIREQARAWYEDSKEPFVVALSRKGALFLHEAFGTIPRETRFPFSSITKFVAGALIARFVDQGLVQLDDPVGKHLPDWPKTGQKVVTIRQCYTHTSGLGTLGDIAAKGPWLDNQLVNALDIIEPGKRFEYSDNGYNLAGSVLETITGQSVARLVYEQIFEPIGGTPIGPPVLGDSVQSTALDLVRLGQLALNKGSYGNKRLFSSVTFDALLPRPLNDFFPDLDPSLRVGIGIEAIAENDPRAGNGEFAEGKVLLSRNTIGHSAASSTVFRVDPDHQLVVAVARRQRGKDYDRHLSAFLQAVDDAIR